MPYVVKGAIGPDVLAIDASLGQVPLELVFPESPNRAAVPRALGGRRSAVDSFENLSWASDLPVSLPRLQEAIGQLAPKLARAKGLFETEEQLGRRLLFQLTCESARRLTSVKHPIGGLMHSRCTLRLFCTDQTGLEQVDLRAAIHLALDELGLLT